jgi:hypothetical protein
MHDISKWHIDCIPLCSFNASATVSKPKCVVPRASCGAFGGGVCCCACLTEHEKHLKGSLVALLLLSASNCRPIRVLDACMFAYSWRWESCRSLGANFLDARWHVPFTLTPLTSVWGRSSIGRRLPLYRASIHDPGFVIYRRASALKM